MGQQKTRINVQLFVQGSLKSNIRFPFTIQYLRKFRRTHTQYFGKLRLCQMVFYHFKPNGFIQ